MTYCSKCAAALSGDTRFCPQCGQDQSEAVPAHHMKPGTLLEYRYWVGKALGEGGFGITYIGRDTKLDMPVAIKEYYPNGYVSRSNTISAAVETSYSADRKDFFEKGRERFLKEARTLARFSGEPGIVNVRDFFEQNNTAYIVMEYLDGETLKEYLHKNGTMPAQQVLHLLMPIMKSLQKIHAQDLIHRDISPDNIMLINGKVKLLDFGAARDVTAVGNKSLSVMLKPGYAPEEQYRSRGIQGPWTDVYALSATIYKCITGITPDDSTQRVFCDEVKTPSELGIKIDPSFETALMKGMAVSQKDRYQSITELLDGFNGTGADLPETGGLDVEQKSVETVCIFDEQESATPEEQSTDNVIAVAPVPSSVVLQQTASQERHPVTVGGSETVALQDADGNDETVLLSATPSEDCETVCLFDEQDNATFEDLSAPVAASLAYAAEYPTREEIRVHTGTTRQVEYETPGTISKSLKIKAWISCVCIVVSYVMYIMQNIRRIDNIYSLDLITLEEFIFRGSSSFPLFCLLMYSPMVMIFSRHKSYRSIAKISIILLIFILLGEGFYVWVRLSPGISPTISFFANVFSCFSFEGYSGFGLGLTISSLIFNCFITKEFEKYSSKGREDSVLSQKSVVLTIFFSLVLMMSAKIDLASSTWVGIIHWYLLLLVPFILLFIPTKSKKTITALTVYNAVLLCWSLCTLIIYLIYGNCWSFLGMDFVWAISEYDTFGGLTISSIVGSVFCWVSLIINQIILLCVRKNVNQSKEEKN